MSLVVILSSRSVFCTCSLFHEVTLQWAMSVQDKHLNKLNTVVKNSVCPYCVSCTETRDIHFPWIMHAIIVKLHFWNKIVRAYFFLSVSGSLRIYSQKFFPSYCMGYDVQMSCMKKTLCVSNSSLIKSVVCMGKSNTSKIECKSDTSL